MADSIRFKGPNDLPITPQTVPVRPATDRRPNIPAIGNGEVQPSFAEQLKAQQGLAPVGPLPGLAGTANMGPALRFSAHAQTRIQSRQIALDAAHLTRLQGAVQRAANKGSRDTLVLMDDLAMVVSVTNRTVVTVVDKDSIKQNVFTNIDSAVIA